MSLRQILIAIGLLCASLPAHAQSAGQTVDVGGWKITRTDDPDKTFNNCTASITYDDDSILGFVVDRKKELYVILSDPGLKLTRDQIYKTEYYIDKAAPIRIDAVDTNANSLIFPVIDDGIVVPAVMKGSLLFIEADGYVTENSLDGSSKAIDQLGECVVRGVAGK